MKTLKKWLKFVNLFLFVIAFLFIGVGIWLLTETLKYGKPKMLKSFIITAIIILIGGVLLLITGFIGSKGVVKNRKDLLLWNMIFMAIIILCELTAIGLVSSGFKIERMAGTYIGELISLTTRTKSRNPAAILDTVQTKLSCCGAYSSSDYLNYIPASCFDDLGLTHEKGCGKAIHHFFKDTSYAFLAICGIIVIGQIAIFVATYNLWALLRTQRYSFDEEEKKKTPKNSPKTSLENSPDILPKNSPKNSPKISPKDSPKDSSVVLLKKSPKSPHKKVTILVTEPPKDENINEETKPLFTPTVV